MVQRSRMVRLTVTAKPRGRTDYQVTPGTLRTALTIHVETRCITVYHGTGQGRGDGETFPYV